MLFQQLGGEEMPTTPTVSMAMNGPLNTASMMSQRRKSYYDVQSFALKGAPSIQNPNDMFAKYIQQSCVGESTFIEPSADEENFRDYIRRLDTFYKLINKVLIENQSPTTGLFPLYGNTNQQNACAHVRDNVYCALTIWALRQSYFKIDNDNGRTHELGQSAVKCMRGILYCWMKDASKVEKFKSNPTAENALPVKFHIRNGGEIEDRNYGHLQIDCVSLYLLYLAQMIASGLQIVYSKDEVDFIQNLIFYVERAYRTPDYGIWERGSKYNINECELHASSIGMAKAALEALNGFDLYGDNGCSWSVVYVDVDAHNRNRTTLETLLPRESSSKNVDAAALTVIGFPAFVIHDDKIINKTLSKINRRLKGNYGFKRFLRDGAYTVLEDKNRSFYEISEMKNFDGIECEYPMFYCYMLIYYIFKNNLQQAQHYYEKVQKLVRKGFLPFNFYVPRDNIETEREQPGTSERVPSMEVYANTPHLWTQSIWILCQMLVDKAITIQDLDPLRRYLQPNERPRLSKRYSTFKGFYSDLTINICCIAESVRLQQLLANYGIQTQTPHQIEPIEIWSPGELVKAYSMLGQNSKMGLSGRPKRPVGVLGTSKLYHIGSQRVIFYPLRFEISDFYMSSDLGLLVDDVKNDLEFLSRSWKLQGRPIYVFLIREQNMRCSQRFEILELLSQFNQGNVNGVPVRMERLQTLLSSAASDHLDFLDSEATDVEFFSLKELETDNSYYKSLSDLPREITSVENFSYSLEEIKNLTDIELANMFNTTSSGLQRAIILHELMNRHGIAHLIDNRTIEECFNILLAEATNVQNWKVIRYCTSALKKTVDSMAPSITNLLVRGKTITLGVFGHDEIEITKPLTPHTIKNILYTNIFPYDVYQAVLMQELIINMSKFISTTPELFNGILKIRLGWIVDCMKLELEDAKNDIDEQMNLYELSPNQIKQWLYYILTCNKDPERNMLRKRQLDGALNRVPSGFYECVWSILKKSPGGITLYDFHLPQQPTLSDMTDYELNFSLKVEQMLSKIEQPIYRQIVVEMFVILNTIMCRNPEFVFQEAIDVEKIVNTAISNYCKDRKLSVDNRVAFFSEKPCIYNGTSLYLAKVCLEHLLQYDNVASNIFDSAIDNTCKIS